MYYIKKTLEISGAHSLRLPYQSKCSNLHGHNWIITIYCRAEDLNPQGMVVDFSQIKETISRQLDHRNLNEVVDFNPTAENMAAWICNQVHGCYRVDIQESAGNTACYIADDALSFPQI